MSKENNEKNLKDFLLWEQPQQIQKTKSLNLIKNYFYLAQQAVREYKEARHWDTMTKFSEIIETAKILYQIDKDNNL